MQSRIRPQTFARIAALTFAAQAVYAVVHLATDGRYPGYDHEPHDPAHDTFMAVAWLSGAAAMLMARPWTMYVAAAATMASFAHFLLVSISLPYVGLPFLLAAALQTVCLGKAWSLFQRSQPSARAHEPAREFAHRS